MNRIMLATAVLLALSCLILSLVPVFPQLNETCERWSHLGREKTTSVSTGPPLSQTRDISNNPTPNDDATNLQSESQEAATIGKNQEQPDSPLSQDYVEKIENQTLPVRLDAVLHPSEFEPIQFTQP